MNKFLAVLQMVAAVVLGILALATAVNLVLFSNNSQTLSVVNVLVGQGVLIICLAAASNIIFRRGLNRYRSQAPDVADSEGIGE